MSGKINSRICLMLSVYESFHETVKYGQQRNHILQDLEEEDQSLKLALRQPWVESVSDFVF